MLRRLLFVMLVAFLALSCTKKGQERPILAPYFEVKGLDGKIHKLTDYRGKPLLVVFWATWCPTCHRELHRMAQRYQEIKKAGLQVLLICESKDPEAIKRTAEEYGFSNMPIAIISDQMMMDYQWVRFLPTGILIDAKGYIVKRFTGELPIDEILKSASEAR